MNDYKRLFEQISPTESDEVLISKVRARKAENMKDNNTHRHFTIRKAVIVPAAAVLVIGAATVSVGAANNWDYARAFRGMFSQRYEGNVSMTGQSTGCGSLPAGNDSVASQNVQTAELVPEKPIGTFDFEKYGKELGVVMEGDGYTAALDGMLVYDDFCYIMYTATASDELLAETDGIVPGLRIDFGSMGFKIDGKFAGGMGYRTETLSEEGNMKTGCIEISYDTVDLAGKTLNIDFLAEKRAGDPSTAVLNRHEDIVIDFNPAENIKKELSLDFATDGFEGKFTGIKVSGLKFELDFAGSEISVGQAISPETTGSDSSIIGSDELYEDVSTSGMSVTDDMHALGDAVVTLNDGTTVVAVNYSVRTCGGNEATEGSIEFRYTYPVDPGDVQSIAFGGFDIDIG